MRRNPPYYSMYNDFYKFKKILGLSQTECDIFGCINSMCFSPIGMCWYTNEQFAEAFQLTERQVQKCLSSLKEVGLIDSEIIIGQHKRQTRKIVVNDDRITELIGDGSEDKKIVMKEEDVAELFKREELEMEKKIKKEKRRGFALMRGDVVEDV